MCSKFAGVLFSILALGLLTGSVAGQVAPAPSSDPPTTKTAPQTEAAKPVSTVETTAAADAVSGPVKAVADEGRALWSKVLQPTGQRFAEAVPGLVKAALVLLAFWVLALLLGAATRKLLGLTDIDERAARDWGLAGLLARKDGAPYSIGSLMGTAVKWVVLLFGFVAFFQALELGMVAEPLRNVVDQIFSVIPSLLQAALILFAYWIIASLLRLVIVKGLGLIGFDDRVSKYWVVSKDEVSKEEKEPSRPTDVVGRLGFYLVLLFGLPPFLDALGQRSLVLPLSDMLATMLSFLPNLVAALVIFFIGRLVATVIREIVTNFLAAAGADAAAQRFGLEKAVGDSRLSQIGGAASYFFIILPVIAAAVESLGIRAISDPLTLVLERLVSAVPLAVVAIIVIAVGYAVARMVRDIVESFLKGIGFDELPSRLGLDFMTPKEGKPGPSAVVGMIVLFAILLLTAQQALATLHMTELAALVADLVGFLPNLLIGLALVLATLSVATYVRRLVGAAVGDKPSSAWLATGAQAAILFVGISMGLSELGVGREVINIVVAATLGGTALAMGLAFGLGGRDRAKEIVDKASR
ncbi:MAG: mechanosensitive ion channel [Thermoanaerobaculia bacterium]|nr:mechanosensitive ion channel [Thermoanaerobaculia bacterium]